MKKFIIVILLLLIAAWSGASYYTGLKAEQEVSKQLEQINQQLALENTKIEQVKFERGIFTSDVAYKLTFVHNNEQSYIPFTGTLYHGPLPLNLVKQFDFMPVMFSSYLELEKNAETEKWFTTEKTPFISEFSLAYNQRIKGKYALNLKDFLLHNTYLTLDLESEYNLNHDFKDGKVTSNVKELIFSGLGGDAGKQSSDNGKLIFKDLKLDLLLGNEVSNFPYITNIDYLAKAKEINLIAEDVQPVSIKLNNVDISFLSRLSDNVVNYKLNKKFGDVSVNDVVLGSLQHSTELNNIDAKSIGHILSLFFSPEFYANQNLTHDEFYKAGTVILENSPELKESIVFERENKKLRANLDVGLNKLKVGNIDLTQGLSLFKDLSFNVELDKNLAIDIISLTLQKENGFEKDQADKKATIEVEQMLSEAKIHNIVIEDGNLIKFNLHRDGNVLDVNGQKITNEEVVNALLTMFF